MMLGGLWGVMTVVGPILLLAVIIWAWLRNRRAGPASVDRAEAGAERLQQRMNAERNDPHNAE